jgi:arylsulfatase A-like enzyme
MRKDQSLAADLSWAALLGILLLGISHLRLWGDTGSAAFGSKVIDATLAEPIIGSKLGSNLLLYALAQAALHSVFAMLCVALGHLTRFAWNDQKNSRRSWAILWFLAATVCVLVANATWYPTSSLGDPYAKIAAESWNGINLLTICIALLSVAFIATLLRAAMRLTLPPPRTWMRWAVPAVAVPLFLFIVVRQGPAQATAQAADKPNIVIIGLDSLRYDAVGRQPALTPSIDAFLQESVAFSDATTPLARTFPSWVSLITGRHPHTTGATVNLLPRHVIKTGETLPQMLSRAGYRSVYAIDEVRFSNLDLSYGFDQMIAPRIGATDFLLGFFGDTPLSNVVMNTRIGALLFPYTHANRAAALTYDPDSFVRRIDRELEVRGPTLLAVHLTLAHWPYTWAGSTPVYHDTPKRSPREVYEEAVLRVDQQFESVLTMLERHGMLDNALVFVLSDHGEDLGEEEDDAGSKLDSRFDPAQLYGHGTSVFSRHQYHVVLAARAFGKASLELQPGTVVAEPVSLEDVTPTLADLLSLQPAQPFDGVSLLPLLRQEPTRDAFANRIRFTETEFNPPGFIMGTFATPSALRTAASFYKVDPETDRVLVREEDLEIVLEKRQYAAFRGSRMVVAFPSSDPKVLTLEPGLVDLPATKPTPLSRAMLETDPDVGALWQALETRFPDLVPKVAFAAEPPP